MVNLMLKILEFKAIFLHQESVLATFGTATAHGWVVDIGASKINIAWVEDGSIIPGSVIRMNYGGDDMTNLLFDLLHRRKSSYHFPKDVLSKDYQYHWNLMNKFKETYCRWILDEREIVKRCTFWVHDKGKNPNLEVTVNCSEVLQVVLLSLFYPKLINAAQTNQDKHMLDNPDYYDFNNQNLDPEDVIDDILAVLVEVAQNRYGTAPKNKEETTEPLITDLAGEKSSLQTIQSMYEYMKLEELIAASIWSVKSPETRKKMSSRILLTGGTIRAKEYVDIIDIIEEHLIQYITQIDSNIDKVDVIQIKDQDPRFFTWIGGSVCPRLETSKDMFISREQWACTFKNFDKHVKEERVRRVLEKDDEEKRKIELKQSNQDQDDNSDLKLDTNSDAKAFKIKEKAFGKDAVSKIDLKSQKAAETKIQKISDRGELDLGEKDIRMHLKKERNMDSGFKILREKVPFQW